MSGSGPSRFPTTATLLSSGLTTPLEREAVRRLIATTQSQRVIGEFEADLADAQKDAACGVIAPAELRRLVMLATIAEQLTPVSGGRRRPRSHQRGGGLSDAMKRLLGSMCGVVRRGVAEAGRQQEEALTAMATAFEQISDQRAAAGVRGAFRRAVVGAATSGAIYDLSYGTDGYIGGIVTGIASFLYANSPDVQRAMMSLVGAADVGGRAAALGVGTAVGVASVTYASYLIMKALESAGAFARGLPNPTDPAQIHEVVAKTVSAVSGGRVKMSAAYVAPRRGLSGSIVIGPAGSSGAAGAGAGAEASVRGPQLGENDAGRNVQVFLLEDGAVERDAATSVQEALQATAAAMGLTVEALTALKARNAARFRAGGSGAMEEEPEGGRRHPRRGTRKHPRRHHRRHTRKH